MELVHTAILLLVLSVIIIGVAAPTILQLVTNSGSTQTYTEVWNSIAGNQTALTNPVASISNVYILLLASYTNTTAINGAGNQTVIVSNRYPIAAQLVVFHDPAPLNTIPIRYDGYLLGYLGNTTNTTFSIPSIVNTNGNHQVQKVV